MYQIIDSKTGLQIGGVYKSRRRASARVDKLDYDYGSYRYFVRIVK